MIIDVETLKRNTTNAKVRVSLDLHLDDAIKLSEIKKQLGCSTNAEFLRGCIRAIYKQIKE